MPDSSASGPSRLLATLVGLRLSDVNLTHNPRSFLIDDDLNLYSFECLKRGGYVVVDPETGEDITRILMVDHPIAA